MSDNAVVMLKEHREFYRKVSDVNSIQPTLRVTGTLIGSSRYSMRLEFSSLIIHMGQFLQGGKNGHLMSFFFLKVEPPCDQT